MRFWDTSALMPLLFEEKSTRRMIALSAADPVVVVSFITPVELASAVSRRSGDKRAAQRMFDALETSWIVIDDYEAIMRRARRLAVKHSLRSADAIQLASAFDSAPISLVTLDEELIAAARAEGFPVLP